MHELARKLIEEFNLPLPGTLPWDFPPKCDCFCVEEEPPCFYSPDEALEAAILSHKVHYPDEFYDVFDVVVHGYMSGEGDDTSFVDTVANAVREKINLYEGGGGGYYVSPVGYEQLLRDIDTEVARLYRRLGLRVTKRDEPSGAMRLQCQALPPKYAMSVQIALCVNDAESEENFREQIQAWLAELDE